MNGHYHRILCFGDNEVVAHTSIDLWSSSYKQCIGLHLRNQLQPFVVTIRTVSVRIMLFQVVSCWRGHIFQMC